MTALDLIEALSNYNPIYLVIFTSFQAFSRKEDRLGPVSLVGPGGVVTVSSGLFPMFFVINTEETARAFLLFLGVCYWVSSSYMLWRKLFAPFTIYQTICLTIYVVAFMVIAPDAGRKFALSCGVIFYVGMIVLMLLGWLRQTNAPEAEVR